MSDRFTQACSELTERNPYICESCDAMFGHPAITHLTSDPGMTGRPDETGTLGSIEFDTMPFGD
jgi:hypothetical protein